MIEPKKIDDSTMHLYGGGPNCSGCGGPTYCVAKGGMRPWWCPDCNVRFTDDGEHGSQARFPTGTEHHSEEDK
jgi:hypothetical protein